MLLFGAADEGEEAAGGGELGLGAGEGGEGEGLGELEGGGVEIRGREGEEGGGGLGVASEALVEEVALPVGGDGAFADGEAKLALHALGDLEVGVIIGIEPAVEELALLGGELGEAGVAAGFAGGEGGGEGGAGSHGRRPEGGSGAGGMEGRRAPGLHSSGIFGRRQEGTGSLCGGGEGEVASSE